MTFNIVHFPNFEISFFLLECFMIFPFVRFFGISVNNRPFNNRLFLLNGGRIRTYVWQGKPQNILSRLDLELLTVVTKAGDNVQFLFCGRWTHKTRCLVSRSTCYKIYFSKQQTMSSSFLSSDLSLPTKKFKNSILKNSPLPYHEFIITIF